MYNSGLCVSKLTGLNIHDNVIYIVSQSTTTQKPLSQLKPNFMWSLLVMGEVWTESLF